MYKPQTEKIKKKKKKKRKWKLYLSTDCSDFTLVFSIQLQNE